MAFDPEKVDLQHADLFYHGKPAADGAPVGLTDEQWDAQKARMREYGDWPYDQPTDQEE